MKSQRKIHPYAEIFPLTEGPPLWELSDRIKANGLREPIVLLGDEILDGRRRELACIRAGVEPVYRTFGSRSTDGFDPLEFVIDTNLHRRHLGEGDRALAAARYAQAKVGRPSENKSRQVDAIFKDEQQQDVTQSNRVDATVSDAECPPQKVVNGSTQNKSRQLDAIILEDSATNADAAKKFDVSETAIDRAKKVLANGTPELQQAVATDIVTVSDAAKVASEPPDVQNAAVDEVKNGKARSATRAARKIKEAKAEEKPKEEIDESPWVDAWGIPITKEASAAFANQDKFDELLTILRKAQKLFKELAELPGGEYLQQPFVSANTRNGFIHNGLATCIMNVADCKPKYTVCPYAYNPDFTHDNKCTLCKGLGWVCAVSKSNGPPESLIQAAKQAHGVQ